MDLKAVNEFVKDELLNSKMFPCKSGTLKRVFFDSEFDAVENTLIQPILNSEELIVGKNNINYGKLLEVAPSIRYAIKRDRSYKGFKYNYIKHKNRHFRYIDRILKQEVIPAIENEFGVKRV